VVAVAAAARSTRGRRNSLSLLAGEILRRPHTTSVVMVSYKDVNNNNNMATRVVDIT
jgi:hypothetical protein